MKILIVPDSFKGSLKSIDVIACVKKSALQHYPNAIVVEVPIADGGDGTVEAMVHATQGRVIHTKARDPLGREIACIYGEAAGAAVIGMSEVSGLALLKEGERSATLASSHGTGDLIRQALDAGFRDILVGIGGSASNDGGTGALQALGVKFLRGDGSEIERMCGRELMLVARMDDTGLDARLREARITIMCDVTNPMTGLEGATYVYGPQKGANRAQLEALEEGMVHFATLLDDYVGSKISGIPGTGAAGGIGAGLTAFADAKLQSGIDAVLERVSFARLLKGADLVVTGEGRVDFQSAFGKVVHGVTRYANEAKVPVIVIAGSIGQGAQAVFDIGVRAIVPLPDKPMTLEECIGDAERLVSEAAGRAFALIDIGRAMRVTA
jgi:glycerate kinase